MLTRERAIRQELLNALNAYAGENYDKAKTVHLVESRETVYPHIANGLTHSIISVLLKKFEEAVDVARIDAD